ncbi:uncharacterized protein KY384_003551 [Bacidia gigantensis]|uniref:uncharacterized protein n=1 Tax=Bacidia gigantensis TaxID=2732470 RepID=UPI001D03657F|nr:uncharacterized protein KY384_003551 [Bacidia gigantensis]KAG8531915.1 hypothetical protein KY384_003551 [Bacidia gigantensis]
MASRIDFDALRRQTLGAGNDEAVTVNTRALIDKVLARYSGEWTTLRELLQNAADASSKHVKISLETLPSATIPVPQTADSSTRLKHVLLHHKIKSTRVENDGEVFHTNDWARLKKIAEGNPDETKIGAFGVGFYSVFADSEEPFVSSGKEALAFYWKGDALFTKSLQLPNGQVSKTTFMLPNRSRDSPVPNLLSLCRFLASSLTFVGLEEIELLLDEWKIMTLRKKSAPSFEVQIPKEVNRKTKDGIMQVGGVSREASQLDAQWLKAVEWNVKAHAKSPTDPSGNAVKGAPSTQSLRGFFSRLAPGTSNKETLERQATEERESQTRIAEDILGIATATIFVHVNRASVRTLVSPTFSAELERATKKPPPKQTTISLLSASFDETEASSSDSATQTPGSFKIFESFVPTNGKGRIFIGFTTNQTTGLNVHISTPSVIPTVERESIDLNNRYIRTWNVELLRVAGIIARIAWGGEMQQIQDKLSRTIQGAGRQKVIKEDITAVSQETVFLHKAYSFEETTPAAEVGTLMEEAFWTCNQKVAISTLSTSGVLPASQVRLEPEELSFVEGIPSLPAQLLKTGLVKKLIDYGVITEVTVSDIKSELERKAINAAQLKQFLGWVLQKVRVSEMDVAMAQSLLSAAVANDDEDGTPKLIILGEMKSFLNPNRIPAEMPIPPSVLPFKFTKDINKPVLELLFDDLQIVPWLRWLVENTGGRGDLTAAHNITQNAKFATSVLPIISKQWDGLSQSSKATVVDLLSSRTTMPTMLGMKKPAEAYFPHVKLFDDLPVVTGLHSVKDKFLASLGVRKTIEIGVIFERLMNASNKESQIPNSSHKWNHVDLIKYLASIRQDIPSADIKILRSTKICPAETETLQPTKERYMVSELYQPDQSLRKLKLRTLQWPGVYRPESSEGKFLTYLGLQTHPTHQELIKLTWEAGVDGNIALRDQALKFFIDHHQTKGYASVDSKTVTLPFLPIQGSEKKVAAPGDVFVNEKSAILGFDILRRDLQVHALKFGVSQDPPIEQCIDRLLKNPPKTKRDAREVFSYFAGRISDISNQNAESLGGAKVVPTLKRRRSQVSPQTEKTGERVIHVPPRACFLGHGDSKYADIFDYVDFGQEANSFLLRVGSKHEPSITELAKRLVVEPAKLFSILGDARYLELLRNIADSWSILKKDKAIVKDMKSSKCLLAYREIPTGPSNSDVDDDYGSAIKSWELVRASEIVVIDDINVYAMFREVLLAAPMEESLEALYHSLGASQVGSLLEERLVLGNLEADQTPALQLQRLIHERSRLYLHDYRSDAIKHDHNWIQKNLKVECVKSIVMTATLKGYNLRKKEKKNAVRINDKPVLYVTSNYEKLEVSQAVAPLLLHRVKPQSIFMLEMMLGYTLTQLGRRGYNVQRILNEKAREAKIAEDRRKELEVEERKRIKDQEAEWEKTQAAKVHEQQQMQGLPGIFPDSPDRQSSQNNTVPVYGEPQLPRPGLFSGISKQFDQVKKSFNQTQTPVRTRAIESPQPSEDAPPPYSPQAGPRPTPPQAESVTAPHHVQQNLMNLIQASRPHNSNSISSETIYNDVKETNTYCDAKPAHNLSYIGESSGLRIFLDKDAQSKGLTPQKFMEANASALNLFASILFDCADIFTLKRDALHIFYDDSGSTIAFNRAKALFFNYRYFDNLHLAALQQGKGRMDAVIYWSVTMAHELAHNIVSDHSSQHSYYTESLIAQYFGKIAIKTAQGSQAGVAAQGRREGSRNLIEVD